MIRFASLGSGSRGNSMVVESGSTRVLVDAGFGPREIERRLARLALTPEMISAVLVTHEHADHAGGVAACARRFGWSIYLTRGTLAALDPAGLGDGAVQIIDGHAGFAVEALEVQPVVVPHDAREPVQFRLSDGTATLGILTDAGHVTAHMVEMLAGCDALVLECNHDLAMLAAGRYPPALKARIGGRFGHLDNGAAADLLGRLDTARLRHLVAAHLSEENNRPHLALAALAAVLGTDSLDIGFATQDDGFGWRTL